jgi:hypothetical protein
MVLYISLRHQSIWFIREQIYKSNEIIIKGI